MIWGSVGFLVGIILGSFVKVLADRSLGRRSFGGRSYCPKCQHKLAWYDLFPILSLILLRGKCRYCKHKIGMEYLIVEVVMGILVGFLFWQSFSNFQSFDSLLSLRIFDFQFLIFILELIIKIFFIVVLVVLFLTDLKKMFIPDRIILPSIVIGVILGTVSILLKIGYFYYLLSQSAIGKLLLPPHSEYFQRHAIEMAQPFLLSILMGLLIGGFFYGLIVVTKGKGMGGGDVKLGAFLGLILGFPYALGALMLAFITGAVFSIGLIILGKKHFGQTIPFGPFLVLGSLVMLFWGQEIINWYLNLSR